MKNIYFVILAESHNDVCAIAEAHKLIRMGGPEYKSIKVRTCDTKELIAYVSSDGTVGLSTGEAVDDPDVQVKEIQDCCNRLGDKLKARVMWQ